jgi:hypothetical protein
VAALAPEQAQAFRHDYTSTLIGLLRADADHLLISEVLYAFRPQAAILGHGHTASGQEQTPPSRPQQTHSDGSDIRLHHYVRDVGYWNAGSRSPSWNWTR